jgi:hypothetical protein
MAYTEEEINTAILRITGDIAAGKSFKDAFSSGSRKIDTLRTSQAKAMGTSLDNQKKMLEVEKLRQEVQPTMDPKEIAQVYTAEQAAKDATIHQAYGMLDSLSFGVGAIGETFGMEQTGTRVSREAATALHKQIKIVLTGSFKGRPSNYLLREIEELIPQVGKWVGGDAYAQTRYEELRNKFNQWLPELDGEIDVASGKTKIELIKQKAKAEQISKRLDVVINGFTEGGTKPNVNAYPDVPIGYEFPDDEEGLQDVLAMFNATVPGEPYKK